MQTGWRTLWNMGVVDGDLVHRRTHLGGSIVIYVIIKINVVRCAAVHQIFVRPFGGKRNTFKNEGKETQQKTDYIQIIIG